MVLRALALVLLALEARADLPARQRPPGAAGATAESADVVWRYDTDG